MRGRRRAARAGGRRDPHPRRRRSCAACARCATSTAPTWSSTRSRPASGAPARCGPSSRPASSPDLLTCGKGVTAGYLPLSAVLATEEIYEAFLGAPRQRPHLLPRPPLHRQPAVLRGRDREPRPHGRERHGRARGARRRAHRRAGSPPSRPTTGVLEIRRIGTMTGIEVRSVDGERTGMRGLTAATRDARRADPAARRRRRADAAARDRRRRPRDARRHGRRVHPRGRAVSDPHAVAADPHDRLREHAERRRDGGPAPVADPARARRRRCSTSPATTTSAWPATRAWSRRAVDAVRRWGAGATGSRLVTGTTRAHARPRGRARRASSAPRPRSCSRAGYLANLAAVTRSPATGDLVVSRRARTTPRSSTRAGSRRADVAVAAARATPTRVERLLAARRRTAGALVVTDAVFSVDGDARAARRPRGCRAPARRRCCSSTRRTRSASSATAARARARRSGVTDATTSCSPRRCRRRSARRAACVLGPRAVIDHVDRLGAAVHLRHRPRTRRRSPRRTPRCARSQADPGLAARARARARDLAAVGARRRLDRVRAGRRRRVDPGRRHRSSPSPPPPPACAHGVRRRLLPPAVGAGRRLAAAPDRPRRPHRRRPRPPSARRSPPSRRGGAAR